MGDAYAAPDPDETPGESAPAVSLPSITTRKEWVDDWDEATRNAQKEARLDRDYYDTKQWTSEELERLRARRQPPITINRIKPKINFIRGEEIKKRVDPVAHPRTPQHADASRAATDALRFVEEQQKFDQARSEVFLNILVEGYGGAIKGIEEDGDEIKHTLTHIQWDRLGYDPKSRAPDFGDAKYLFIVRWADEDDAILDYPDFAATITGAVNEDRHGYISDTMDDTPRRWIDGRRRRVKIIEMYFRIGKDWYRSDFIEGTDLLPPERTAFLDEKQIHSMCPLKMTSCYVDAEGYRYGIVRDLRSPQDEVNKRASKGLHLLNVKGVIAERDAVPNPQKFQDELAKPDGFAEVNPDTLVEGRVQVTDSIQLAAGHAALAQQAIQNIDSVGPSSAQIPDLPGAASGRAVIARRQASSQELGSVFDHLRDWTHSIFEIDWLSIRLWMTEELWLRVTDDHELTGYRFTAINQRMTRAQRFKELMDGEPAPPPGKAFEISAGTDAPVIQATAMQLAQQMQQRGQKVDPMQLVMKHPMMQELITVNQIDQMLVDIIIDEAPETAILEQEEFDKLVSMVPQIVQARPDMAGTMAKMVVGLSQFRDKNKIIEAFDKAPSKEDQAKKQQQEQAQQQQIQGQLQALQAQVAELQSRAQLNQAKTQQVMAEAQTEQPLAEAQVQKDNALAMKHAAEAGEKTGIPE